MKHDASGIHVHQSDVKSWLNCGEQVRLVRAVADDGRFQTDAATVGTVTHQLIESELVDGFYQTEKDAQAHAAMFFVETLEGYAAAGDVYTRSSFDTDSKALKVVERLAATWYHSPERAYLASLGEGGYITEWTFDVPLGLTFQNTDVFFAGQADLLIPFVGLWDWKTASQAYRRWEKQRYDVQSTGYTYAAWYEGLLTPDRWGEYSMTFKVFDTKLATPGPPDSITVKRSPNNWNWLRTQVSNMLSIQYGMPDGPWPLNDNHVLCSPKWCPVWDSCKGAHVSGETWV
jgi:hypothetical protein